MTSGVDHFIPGLAVDPATSGSGAHLALTYYFYPDATCTGGCQLDVGYISSPDGGAHWGDADSAGRADDARARSRTTSQGPMVGDYISTSFSGGTRDDRCSRSAARSTTASRSTRRCTRRPRRSTVATPASAANLASSDRGRRATTGVKAPARRTTR